MKITFLGTGTCHQQPERSTTSIDCDGWGTHFLIDVGSGALRRAREAEIDPDTIEAVFLTHFHPDHSADLIPLIHMYQYNFPQPRSRPLHIFGPAGLEKTFNELLRLMLPEAVGKLRFPVELHEIGNSQIEFGHVGVVSRVVTNSDYLTCLGYRFSANKKSFAFTGDSSPCPALSELGKGVDLYVMDCTRPNDQPVDVHLTPAQDAKIAQAAGAKELILTHIGPHCAGRDLKEEASEFEGEVTVAEDLLEVKL